MTRRNKTGRGYEGRSSQTSHESVEHTEKRGDGGKMEAEHRLKGLRCFRDSKKVEASQNYHLHVRIP